MNGGLHYIAHVIFPPGWIGTGRKHGEMKEDSETKGKPQKCEVIGGSDGHS